MASSLANNTPLDMDQNQVIIVQMSRQQVGIQHTLTLKQIPASGPLPQSERETNGK